MRHAQRRSARAGRRLWWGMWVMLLCWGLSTPLAARERSPQREPSPQAEGTRVAVPRTAPSSPSPATPQAPPTARDTRQVTPRQYRPPARPGRGAPPAGRYYPRTRIHPGYYYPSFYYPYYWHWGWGAWGGWYWYGAPYRGYPAPPYAVRYVGTDLGGLDLNVKPKKAAVYVDGRYAGLVKHFDGYPGYLWLEKGKHEVTFFMEGYMTVTEEFEIRPGQVFDVRFRMEPGEAVWPEERAAPTAAQRGEPAKPYPPPGPDSRAEAVAPERGDQAPSSEETGRLQFIIEPRDASVYLDGRFLGAGSELEALHAGLIVEPGRHQIEVIRPGYSPQQLNVFVEPGGELDLRVKLDEESG